MLSRDGVIAKIQSIRKHRKEHYDYAGWYPKKFDHEINALLSILDDDERDEVFAFDKDRIEDD